jgi:hypothetical protein
MKSRLGAEFTNGGGPGECQPRQLSATIAQNSLFAISTGPSANRPTSLREAKYVPWEKRLTQATPRDSLSDVLSSLLRAPEWGQFDSSSHC